MATLRTLPMATCPWLDVLVVCDGDPGTAAAVRALGTDRINVEEVWAPGARNNPIGAVAARNAASPAIEDGLLYATDDVLFAPGAISKCLDQFNSLWPDDDGALGLRQSQAHHPAGVGLLGKRFLDRYPARKPFCPLYHHFACQEIEWLASKVGRWAVTEEVMLAHRHPCFDKAQMDQTHRDARTHREADLAILQDRNAEGLIWGDSQ